jgi:hypothetical protein
MDFENGCTIKFNGLTTKGEFLSHSTIVVCDIEFFKEIIPGHLIDVDGEYMVFCGFLEKERTICVRHKPSAYWENLTKVFFGVDDAVG